MSNFRITPGLLLFNNNENKNGRLSEYYDFYVLIPIYKALDEQIVTFEGVTRYTKPKQWAYLYTVIDKAWEKYDYALFIFSPKVSGMRVITHFTSSTPHLKMQDFLPGEILCYEDKKRSVFYFGMYVGEDIRGNIGKILHIATYLKIDIIHTANINAFRTSFVQLFLPVTHASLFCKLII